MGLPREAWRAARVAGIYGIFGRGPLGGGVRGRPESAADFRGNTVSHYGGDITDAAKSVGHFLSSIFWWCALQRGRIAMAVFFMVLAIIGAACGVWSLVLGVRQWQGKGHPLSYWLRYTLKDAESRAGWDRSLVPAGLLCLSGAVEIGNGAISGAQPHNGSAGAMIAIWSLLATMFFAGLVIAIINFNRPRFLVPPHLRGQLGAVAGRRRRRREHLPMR